MEEKPSVVIVSAFGRGNWLAAEISTNLNCEVHLVDVSDSLGRWAPEDWEGPFGLFQSELIAQTQNARLDEEDYADAVDEGFCLWLKSGPLDLRGTHSQYLLDKRAVSTEVQGYLSGFEILPEKRKAELQKNIMKAPFHQNWLACLAHSLASSNFTTNARAITRGQPLPVFSPYAVRRVSRRGVEKSLEWVKSRNVKIYNKAKIKDISLEGSQIQSVEIESEWSGVLRTDQLIWALSGLETRRLGEKFKELIFSSAILEPDWIWVRYRLDFCKPEINDSLPMKFVLVEDLALPWSHANLQLIQKTSSRDNYDVWVRIPAMHRFQKKYLEDISRELIEILKSRLPATEPRVLEYPQEYLYDEATLGPARFCVYNEEHGHTPKQKNYKNIHHDSADLWDNLDWTGQFSHQRRVFEFIKSWKLERDRKIEKQKVKERDRL